MFGFMVPEWIGSLMDALRPLFTFALQLVLGKSFKSE
jgi:hypothetical protein